MFVQHGVGRFCVIEQSLMDVAQPHMITTRDFEHLLNVFFFYFLLINTSKLSFFFIAVF